MRPTQLANLALCLGVLASCSGSTDPIPDPIVLRGEILFQDSEFHTIFLSEAGTLRIRVDELRPKLLDITVLPEASLALGLGLGQISEGSCATTFRTSVREGSGFSFGLRAAEYCVLLFDTGILPEDAIIEYTVSVFPN